MIILHSPAKGGRRALVAASLLFSPALVASPASALQYNFGDVTLQLDTTVSVSAAMRTQTTDCSHVSYWNGGCLQGNGSGWDVNNDDGNINVQQGEVFSAPLKVISEFSGQWRNYGFYMSGKAWYDAAIKDLIDNGNAFNPVIAPPSNDNSGRPFRDIARGDNAYNAALKDAELLDAYAYADWEVGGMPLNVRLGNQVVSWGESTFIQGGVSSYLPLDVTALYQPGLELKEVFLPQGTAYASVGLPENLTLEAMYIYDHKKSELPACGTFFSVSDALGAGCAYGVSDGEYPSAITIYRSADKNAREQGQYGIALRYYADWMGQGTDLGFYFVNFHSKLPFGAFTALDDTGGWMALLNGACGGDLDGAVCTAPGPFHDPSLDAPQAGWRISTSRTYTGIAFFNGEKNVLAQYPEDIEMIGASFNTTATFLPNIFGDGTAISGDLAYYPDMPFQVDTTELLAHDYLLYGFTTSTGSAPIYTGEVVGAGQVIPGYRRKKAVHGSITTLSTLTPSNWFVDHTGGDFGVLLINAGFQYLPGANGNRLAIPGSNATHPNRGVAVALADLCQSPGGPPSQNCSLSPRYASAFSAGYRIYAFQDYHSAFNTGWTITPNLFWSHDVAGYSAGPIGPGFVEGKQVLKLGVDAKYLGVKAGISYTMHMGAKDRNVDWDKDFLAMTVSYAF